MAYYLIWNYDINDSEMYDQYSNAVVATTAEHDIKILVIDREPNNLEGQSQRNLIILEFESEEAAMSWYNSPEYQAILPVRLNATEGWGRGVPEFVMPAT
jgi:uncharacterized protein (DUF1330 family)